MSHDKVLWCTNCGCLYSECICNPGQHACVELEEINTDEDHTESEVPKEEV